MQDPIGVPSGLYLCVVDGSKEARFGRSGGVWLSKTLTSFLKMFLGYSLCQSSLLTEVWVTDFIICREKDQTIHSEQEGHDVMVTFVMGKELYDWDVLGSGLRMHNYLWGRFQDLNRCLCG